MSDELNALLDAFAAEASERVAQAARDLRRLQGAPSTSSAWRSVASNLRVVADSARMMDLQGVERLARHVQEAALATADQSTWQVVAAAVALAGTVAALQRMLAGLPQPNFDREAALAAGLEAYAAWERLARGPLRMSGGTAALTAAAPSRSAVVRDSDMPAWVQAGPSDVAASAPPPSPGPAALPTRDHASGHDPVAARIERWRRAMHQGDRGQETPTAVPQTGPLPESWSATVRVEPAAAAVPLPVTPDADGRPGWLRGVHADEPAAPPQPVVPDPVDPAWLTGQLAAEPTADRPSWLEELAAGQADTPMAVVPHEVLPAVGATVTESATVTLGDVAATDDGALAPGPGDILATELTESELEAMAHIPDAALLEIFGEEVSEHLVSLQERAAVLRHQPGNLSALDDVRRSMHTLKGAAGMVGVLPVHRLCMAAEETLEGYIETGGTPPAALVELLDRTISLLKTAGDSGFSASTLAEAATFAGEWTNLAGPHATHSLAAHEAMTEPVAPAEPTVMRYQVPDAASGTSPAVSADDEMPAWFAAMAGETAEAGPTQTDGAPLEHDGTSSAARPAEPAWLEDALPVTTTAPDARNAEPLPWMQPSEPVAPEETLAAEVVEASPAAATAWPYALGDAEPNTSPSPLPSWLPDVRASPAPAPAAPTMPAGWPYQEVEPPAASAVASTTDVVAADAAASVVEPSPAAPDLLPAEPMGAPPAPAADTEAHEALPDWLNEMSVSPPAAEAPADELDSWLANIGQDAVALPAVASAIVTTTNGTAGAADAPTVLDVDRDVALEQAGEAVALPEEAVADTALAAPSASLEPIETPIARLDVASTPAVPSVSPIWTLPPAPEPAPVHWAEPTPTVATADDLPTEPPVSVLPTAEPAQSQVGATDTTHADTTADTDGPAALPEPWLQRTDWWNGPALEIVASAQAASQPVLSPGTPGESVPATTAGPEAAAPPAERRSSDEEAELAGLFAEEVGEGLTEIQSLLSQLTEGGHESDTGEMALTDDKRQALLGLRRVAHTLKGAAAMLGRQAFATATHRMEDALERLADGQLPLTAAILNLLFDTLDALQAMATSGSGLDAATEWSLAFRYTAALSSAPPAAPAEAPEAAAVAVGEVLPGVGEPVPFGTAETPEAASAAPVGGAGAGANVRVDLEDLNGLLTQAEELITQRATMMERLSSINSLLRDFARSVERLSRVSRALEDDYEVWGVAAEQRQQHEAAQAGFDSLEFDRYTEFRRLTMEMVEALTDARTAHRDVEATVASLGTLVGRQGRVASSLRKGLEQVSLVSLSGVVPLARRVASQTALGEAKRVSVDTIGLDLMVDRAIYDVVASSIGHLIRNAIVHGIESPELRLARGKEQAGRVTVEARRDRSETVVTVRDDGEGVNRTLIRQKAESLGWLSPGQALSDDDLVNIIFRHGFSTAASLSEAAGRGVGLDAAMDAVLQVRGRMTVESRPGEGTTFTLRLPLALTVADLLLAQTAGRTVALPMHWLTGTMRVVSSAIRVGAGGSEVMLADEWLPVLAVGELLGWQIADVGSQVTWPATVVAVGERRVVLLFDKLLQRQELAVASLGPSFTWLRVVLGACMLGDGTVAPVLDLPALLEQERPAIPVLVETVEEHVPRILVVDDSLSVRRMVSMTITREGWEVEQARDGQEALSVLSDRPVDALVLDIEMPQMDGYAVLERLRGQAELADLPVIMLTSRGAAPHRARAMELGANAYMVKPYDEGALTTTLKELLSRRLVAAR